MPYNYNCKLTYYDMIGIQGSYQGQGGYNQYPGSNEQYGQHYSPGNAPVGYPTGPVRPPLYPPYSNDADR